MYQAAIDRLRKYVPPPTQYDTLPLSRRAAVLILLFADAKGDLRVVVTMRAKTLSSCTLFLFVAYNTRYSDTPYRRIQPCIRERFWLGSG
jgi:hypothetical protein